MSYIQVMDVVFGYLKAVANDELDVFISQFPERHKNALRAAICHLKMEHPTIEAQKAWAKNMNQQYAFMDLIAVRWVPTVMWAVISITQVDSCIISIYR